MTSLASDTSSVTLKSTDLLPDHTSPSPALSSPVVSRPVPIPEENANPWLAPLDGQTVKAVQKKHEVAVGKESGTAEKSKNKLRKRVKKREEEKANAKQDAVVDVEDAVATARRPDGGGGLDAVLLGVDLTIEEGTAAGEGGAGGLLLVRQNLVRNR